MKFRDWPNWLCPWCLNTGRVTFDRAVGEIACPPCGRRYQ